MKKILIIVDMQNGFNRYEQMHILANKIISLSKSEIFDTIIATRFLNKESSQYARILNWHRLENSPDIDLIQGIKYDYVVDKNIYTCINDKFIDFLKDINDKEFPRYVFVCGADTDCCVLKIATDLFESGIMPFVLTEYCASNGGNNAHNSGITVMSRLIGRRCLVEEKIDSKDKLNKITSERDVL